MTTEKQSLHGSEVTQKTKHEMVHNTAHRSYFISQDYKHTQTLYSNKVKHIKKHNTKTMTNSHFLTGCAIMVALPLRTTSKVVFLVNLQKTTNFALGLCSWTASVHRNNTSKAHTKLDRKQKVEWKMPLKEIC